MPVPTTLACAGDAELATRVVRGSVTSPGLSSVRVPKVSTSLTAAADTDTSAPAPTWIRCESSVTPRWKASVLSPANTIWSSALRRSLSKPPPLSLSTETATSLNAEVVGCAAPACVTMMRRPDVVSAKSPRALSVSAKLPPAALPSALPRSAPASVMSSSPVMLSVPALLDCTTWRYGVVAPGAAGRSTAWLAPPTSIAEPASTAITAFFALNEIVPPADRLPCTSPLSLGVATKVPCVDRIAAGPISSRGVMACWSAADSATLIAPPGA